MNPSGALGALRIKARLPRKTLSKLTGAGGVLCVSAGIGGYDWRAGLIALGLAAIIIGAFLIDVDEPRRPQS